MAYVNTTFLPKTNGLVFGDRLVARSDKGRVFGLGVSPPPYTPPTVDTVGSWDSGNTYETAQILTFDVAIFANTTSDTTFRWRQKYRATSDDPWTNGSWNPYDNVNVTQSIIVNNAGQYQIQSQARDVTLEPVVQVNSNTSVKSVVEASVLSTTIGTLSCLINDIAHDLNSSNPITLLMNDPIPAVISIDGDASPSYTWGARNSYPLMVGTPNAASTILTFPSAGTATVTCTLTDYNTEEVNTSVVMNFFVVDAL